jgi:hypothetical protein
LLLRLLRNCETVTWARDSAPEALEKIKSGEFTWGALFWIALMRVADDEKVVEHWLALVDSLAPQECKTDVRYIASTFAELSGCLIAWNQVVQGVEMTESVIANRMIELGELRARREALLRLVRLRFPALLTPDVERAIKDQPSLTLMNTWLDAAFDPATTAESFLALLRR